MNHPGSNTNHPGSNTNHASWHELPRDADRNANAALAKGFHAVGNSVAAAVKKRGVRPLNSSQESMSSQRGTRLEKALMSPFQQAVSGP